MKYSGWLPNSITTLNLLTGCIASLYAFYDIEISAYLVLIAVVLDFLDGAAARWLNARTKIGKQLDALADLVSFGIAPAFILYLLLLRTVDYNAVTIGYLYLLPSISLLVPVFSAWRLARFNINTDEENGFRGLPTPASAILLVSLPLIFNQYSSDTYVINSMLQEPYILGGIIVADCLLMISRLPLLSFKTPSFRWSDFKFQYILLILSLSLIIVLQFAAIPLIILLYIILSLINKYAGSAG